MEQQSHDSTLQSNNPVFNHGALSGRCVIYREGKTALDLIQRFQAQF